MRFCVNMLNFGPHATPTALRGWARFAEDTGFHAALISDHIAVTPDVAGQYPGPFYDPFSTLSWLAGLTERIELGTTVTILPYRHPLHTARITANIDQFSGGRLILGTAAGWARQEFEALGVPYGRRGALTDEYLEALTGLWTRDEFAMTGEFVSFDPVDTRPRPVREPHPPLWIGGNSRAAVRRAVRFGTAWHPINARPAWLRGKGLPALHAEAAAQGRAVPDLAPRIGLRITGSALDEADRPAGHGTLDQIHADLAGLAELGATYVVFDTYEGTPAGIVPPEDDWRTLEKLATGLLDLAGETLRG